MKLKTFSGQLSPVVTKDKLLSFAPVIGENLQKNYYYGKTEWFNELGEFKDDYLKKIKAPILQGA